MDALAEIFSPILDVASYIADPILRWTHNFLNEKCGFKRGGFAFGIAKFIVYGVIYGVVFLLSIVLAVLLLVAVLMFFFKLFDLLRSLGASP